jgi:signal peptidase I
VVAGTRGESILKAMSDSTYDPFNTPPTPPQTFDAPDTVSAEEAIPVPATSEFEPAPVAAEPIPVMGEPVAAMAGGFASPADPRLAIDSGSLRMRRIADEFVAWLKTLASAAVYATLIVTFGFQVARVEGQSMAPTLADQDRLIVNKLAYRLGDPRVGDIVMLYYPIKPEKSFVKRVIAEEGDTVRIVAGKVYRNDVLMDDSFVPAEYRSHDDWGPEVIPDGYYFVMGDHRNNSSDSRTWGYVPKKYIIGKVQLRWWPMPEARLF